MGTVQDIVDALPESLEYTVGGIAAFWGFSRKRLHARDLVLMLLSSVEVGQRPQAALGSPEGGGLHAPPARASRSRRATRPGHLRGCSGLGDGSYGCFKSKHRGHCVSWVLGLLFLGHSNHIAIKNGPVRLSKAF